MKLFVLFLAVCLAYVNSDDIEEIIEPLQPKLQFPTANNIKKKIEALRVDLVEKGYNDLHFADKELSLDSAALGISGSVKATGKLTGLAGFEIAKLTGLLRYKYELVWPEVVLDIQPYALDADVHMINVFGHGKLHAKVKGLNLKGSLAAKLLNMTHAHVTDFDIAVKLSDQPEFSMTGWLDDDERSKILSALLQEKLPRLLAAYQPEISAFLEKTVMDMVKDILIPI